MMRLLRNFWICEPLAEMLSLMLVMYVVSYIRIQLPHTNKLVPDTHQVLQQVFLRCFPLCVCLVPVTHVCPSIYLCVPHRMFLQSLRELERALRTLW